MVISSHGKVQGRMKVGRGGLGLIGTWYIGISL
jgi:hypothetical protein